jgi:hypothetical protein
MITPYLATLTVTETEKGDDTLEEVTLPFAHEVLDDPDSFLSCGWTPHYRAGHSGLYYLVTGADTDHHTLVDSAGFRPDDASSVEDLISCDPDQAPACEDVTCGTCETCEAGECHPVIDEIGECEDHADCEGGGTCVSSYGGECQSFCSVKDPEEITTCEDSGGTWDGCVLGVATTCENRDSGLDGASVCREGCLCPEDAPILTADGCVAESACDAVTSTPQETCEDSGGSWDECAASSCDSCADCIADCLCGQGEAFDASLGCVTPSEEVPTADAAEATDSEGGCSGGGSEQTGFALLFALTLLGLGIARCRRVTVSLRG